MTPELEAFLAPFWDDADPLLKRIQEDIHRRSKVPMQISLEQVAFHGWLCRLLGARRVLEVGTYLGLSSAGFAQADPGIQVDTIEIDPEHADIAEGWHREGGLQDRIRVHRGPALEVMAGLTGPYDLCFFDGDKNDNPGLIKEGIRLTRKGGVILVDNAFRDGRVPTESDEGTRRALELARELPELDPVVLPVADGILACRIR